MFEPCECPLMLLFFLKLVTATQLPKAEMSHNRGQNNRAYCKTFCFCHSLLCLMQADPS